MTATLNSTPLRLHPSDTPAWQLWSQLVELSRHLYDLAQLSATIDDPLTLAAALDKKERRALRRVTMPAATTADPWLQLASAHRNDAVEAWQTIIE